MKLVQVTMTHPRATTTTPVVGPDLGLSVSAHLSIGVRLTLAKVMMNSPAGMVQLIKYFESQSERLDKQSIQTHSASLSSKFESLIKFNGVPILPPAMTASRREKFKQFKREAVFRENRRRARQKRTTPKTDFSALESKDRPTARQLNFDSDLRSSSSSLHHRLNATNPLSAFATAGKEANEEEFGLQTTDSLSSDFVSLEDGTLPTVFSGHTLKSVKEQKISFNLDHLCKELKIQDLGSTSGSDLSDALLSSNTLDVDLIRGERWAEKIVSQKPSAGGQVQMTSFCHDSQDTVVEVSPEAGDNGGGTDQNTDTTSTSEFVDKTDQSTLEQTQTSIGSSPGCGSTTTTTDSQKSKVHFASFILEYNTSASQSFESATVVKKKMSQDHTVEDSGKVISKKGQVISVSGLHDPKHKSVPSNKAAKSEGSSGSSGLLNRVSLHPDSESSPGTPPFDASPGVPFKNYSRNDAYNSDKENEEHRVTKISPKPGTTKHEAPTLQGELSEISHSHGGSAARQLNLSHRQAASRELRNQGSKDHHPQLQGINSFASSGIGPASSYVSNASSHLVGAGNPSISCDSSDLVSISQVSLRPGGVLSMGKHSVSDSSASSKSIALTTMSESSSSTLKEDLTPIQSTDLGLNIVDIGTGHVNLEGNDHKDTDDINESVDIDTGRSSSPAAETENNTALQKESNSYMHREPNHSPKKLNTNHQPYPPDYPQEITESNAATPPGKYHIRRGSYTLSEPSPILIQAKSRLEAERKRRSQLNGDNSMVRKTTKAPSEDDLPLQKRLDFDDADDEVKMISSVPSDPEKEGKAEHISRYLSQVQFQNSMNLHSQSLDHENEENFQNEDNMSYQEFSSGSSVIDVLKSIAESSGSLGQMSDVELQAMQQQQMEMARKALVDQQRKDMEELFIQQRKEVMMFETEIKLAQHEHLEQHKFIVQNAPENIKVKARNHKSEYSPERSGNYLETSKHGSQKAPTIKNNMNSSDNMRPQPLVSRSSQSESQGATSLNLQPKVYHASPGKASLAMNSASGSSESQYKKRQHSSLNMLSLQEETHVKTIDNDSSSPRQKQVMNPVGIANQIPEFGSPSARSPRLHRPMAFKSPHLYTDVRRKARQVVVPPEALQPEMKAKFDRVSAAAKGFLTRCLLRSDKVQALVKTIKDTREFAFNFQTETPIKKGLFTTQDRSLLERIIAQLQAALLDIHEIFFEIPCAERMTLIENTRISDYDKRLKASRDSTRSSGPRMSQATLKALERKRKAQEAEASAMLSSRNTPRPKTAPASNCSKSQNHTDMRALKPLQGQGHGSFHHHNTNTSSPDNDRPRTAPEKQLTRPKRISVQTPKPSQSPVISAASDSSKETSKEANKKPTASSTAKVVNKSKIVPNKPSTGRPGKSWR